MKSDISTLLVLAKEGSDEARQSLFSELHNHMRAKAKSLMSDERANHTLQATALINEACVKLLREGVVDSAENRRQLFHAAIRAMRQVLIDHARARDAQKRGGSQLKRQPMDFVLEHFEETHDMPFLDLENALQRLQQESPRQHEALTFRFFGGLSIGETAKLLECSVSTVESDWRLARAKLTMWLSAG